MTAHSDMTSLLPAPMPGCYNRRMLLFAVRRMAAHGLDDAHAAHAIFGWFGLSFRRPLVLMRALMAELSRVSARKIVVAPCCCGRLTHTEQRLIEAVDCANSDPRASHALLAEVLGVKQCLGALQSAQALAQAFADLGRPFDRIDDCA